MKAEDIVIKLNLKSCCFFEKLTGKSFNNMNSEQDYLNMIYSTIVVNNPSLHMEYNTFLGMLINKKFAAAIVDKYQTESKILEQLVKESEDTKEGDSTPLTMSQIAAALIIQYHMDPHYVMYEMGLWELQDYFKMADWAKKEDLVEKRLWTYLTISPHIDTKKVKTPEKLLPFKWEQEEKKKKAAADLEREKARMNNIIGKDISELWKTK